MFPLILKYRLPQFFTDCVPIYFARFIFLNITRLNFYKLLIMENLTLTGHIEDKRGHMKGTGNPLWRAYVIELRNESGRDDKKKNVRNSYKG